MVSMLCREKKKREKKQGKTHIMEILKRHFILPYLFMMPEPTRKICNVWRGDTAEKREES
jgi:hypothetical protein